MIMFLACLMLKILLMQGKKSKKNIFSIQISQNIANQVADAVGDVDTGAILDNFVDGLDEAKDGALELINGFTENSEGKAAASCALTAVLFFIQ